jgi:hypothetical protein
MSTCWHGQRPCIKMDRIMIKELTPGVLLASLGSKVVVERDGCWEWHTGRTAFLGYHMGQLLYGMGKGPIGRGVEMRGCQKKETCVNPWHWAATSEVIKNRTHCKWGHELSPNGRCRECERQRKARWRKKKVLKEIKF